MPRKLNNNPINIIKATLNPTEKRIVSNNPEAHARLFWAMLLLVILVVLNLSSVISSSVNSITIGCNGQISIANVTANSGSAKDIQVAVNWVATHGGIGNVHIPEGTFNFVKVGEPWMTVTIPAGVNLFGAPTERDANGQVIEWKTVLVMPSDVPGNDTIGIPIWFKILGNNDPNKPSRFSDIKLQGYRDIDPASTSMSFGVEVISVMDFRIDHCYFRHITGGAVIVHGIYHRGVIDHCLLINVYGVPYGPNGDFSTRTIGYGVSAHREGWTQWESNITKVLGQYTNYTIFIEDCYFSKWRHCTGANDHDHFVFRHNIIDNDFAMGSVDAHGPGSNATVGTRAIEVYDNIFENPDPNWNLNAAINLRGGAATIFNNTVLGNTTAHYSTLVTIVNEGPLDYCWPNNVYVWNNNLSVGTELLDIVNVNGTPPIVQNVQYFLHAPDIFSYQPYPYPHPLTLEATP